MLIVMYAVTLYFMIDWWDNCTDKQVYRWSWYSAVFSLCFVSCMQVKRLCQQNWSYINSQVLLRDDNANCFQWAWRAALTGSQEGGCDHLLVSRHVLKAFPQCNMPWTHFTPFLLWRSPAVHVCIGVRYLACLCVTGCLHAHTTHFCVSVWLLSVHTAHMSLRLPFCVSICVCS